MRPLPFLVIIFLLFGLKAAAQQSVHTSGGTATGTGGTVTYSVGQTAYHVASGSGGMQTEGVQQPFEIYILNGIPGTEGIAVECTVFPNPSETFVTLSVKDQDLRNLSYQLCNEMGVAIRDKKIIENKTNLPVEELPKGIYFLTITRKDTTLKTFKIIRK